MFKTSALKPGTATLRSAEPCNKDLAVDQDFSVTYLEQKDLNHSFRVLESMLPRIKRKGAIVVFES